MGSMSPVAPAYSGTGAPFEGLGLRSRVTVAFALGALVVSLGLAALTYEVARTYLVRQREASVLRQAFVNARLVRAGLRAPDPAILEVLSSLETPRGSTAVIFYRGNWFAASLAVGREALPAGLRDRVTGGIPARQRFRLDQVPQLAVGVPIPAVGAAYFEVFSLEEIERTLSVLQNSLLAAAAFTTLAGAAMGRWASSRVLQPVTEAARAAADVASGRLDVRLELGADPDLATLAHSFNEMTDALRERLKRDARFASAISHELRSPLMTVMASVEVLQGRRSELPARSAAALDLLASDLGRFRRLVEDLLEISRIDAGAGELVGEDVQVVEFVRQALRHASRGGVALEYDDDAETMVVVAEKRRLERVVANLVENADSHGGGVLRVTVQRAGTNVLVAVEDSGPGVSPEDRDRIFERFVRGRAAGRRDGGDGTGLGLSLAVEHIRLHQGRVWVEDRTADGGGARFVVELPLVSAP